MPTVLLGALAALLALRSRLTIVTVRGISMSPTLRPGERVLVLRRRRPSRGAIVAARFPDTAKGAWSDTTLYGDAFVPDWVVKRVAAVAGDRVEDGHVVPPGHVYLIGDGALSMDSRQWGSVPLGSVRGVMIARLPGRVA